jgi:NNP family nitrate/nitrite transporter-like MFS transporter
MKNLLTSLKSGNWRSLVACFLYFDTGFTVWVLYGPLAPFISKDITMTAAQQGFLVAVPVLAAAILRVTLGNLYQSTDGRRVALMGVVLSSVPTIVLPLLSGTPSYSLLLVLGVFLGMGGASFAVALPMAGSNYPPKVQGLVLGQATSARCWTASCSPISPMLSAGNSPPRLHCPCSRSQRLRCSCGHPMAVRRAAARRAQWRVSRSRLSG